MRAESNECGTNQVFPRVATDRTDGGTGVDFRSGNEPDNSHGADDLGGRTLFAEDAPAPGAATTEEAGSGPAVGMTEKSDTGTDALVAELGAKAIAGAIGNAVQAAAEAAQADSKSIMARRFDVVTDSSRDALLTDFCRETLDDR